jgi:hypothetical protein
VDDEMPLSALAAKVGVPDAPTAKRHIDKETTAIPCAIFTDSTSF